MNLIALSIPIFLGLIALEVGWDQVKRKGLYRLGDSLSNIGCGIMDQSSGLFAKVLTIGAYAAVFNWSADFRGWNVGSSAAVWIAVFLLTDFAYYWAHRFSHEVNVLWIGHVVHHQSEDYNLGVALRQSILQPVLLSWVYWPLAIVGFPPEMFLTAKAVNLLYQFWIHTELIGRMGMLEWVLNTPSHHRVHHGRNPEYIDRNHGGVFIIWDRMFGTFQEEIVKPTYGITRPTDTFNPIHAQWKPVASLWNDLRRIPGWWDRFRFLFAAPGWYPESIGGPLTPPAISGEEQKFHPRPSRRLMRVLTLRWVMLLAVAFIMLQLHQNYTTAVLGGILLWVLCALAAVGEMWNRGWGWGRLVLALGVDITFVPVAAALAGGMGWGYAPMVSLALLSAAATAWALKASRRYMES